MIFFSVERHFFYWKLTKTRLSCLFFLKFKNEFKFLRKNENFSTFLNGWSRIPKIFPAYFSVKETLVLLFDNVVFSKEGFSDDKNVIL